MRQEGLTLTWRDLSIYVPRESKENLKRIINNGIINFYPRKVKSELFVKNEHNSLCILKIKLPLRGINCFSY